MRSIKLIFKLLRLLKSNSLNFPDETFWLWRKHSQAKKLIIYQIQFLCTKSKCKNLLENLLNIKLVSKKQFKHRSLSLKRWETLINNEKMIFKNLWMWRKRALRSMIFIEKLTKKMLWTSIRRFTSWLIHSFLLIRDEEKHRQYSKMLKKTGQQSSNSSKMKLQSNLDKLL